METEKKNEKISYGYISEYYEKIKNKEIIANQWIEKWYQKILENLEKKQYFYDKKKANRAIKFIENFCRHSEGPLAPGLLKLELWQKALISVVFGILDHDGFRQFREVVVIIARKNGKTLLASAIAAYLAYADGEYGGRIYFCAPKLLQADICYNNVYQMIHTENELSKLAKKRRSDIYLFDTNTSIMPIAFSAKKSDGLNPSLVVCDEIASWSGGAGLKQYEVLKSALGARKQPMILSISTAGYEEDGIYDELLQRCYNTILGESEETRIAPFIYMIDDIKKWNDLEELKKSNPNLNVSVSEEYMKEEIAIANQSYSKKTEFLCKYCNVKQNASTAWLKSEDIKECCGDEIKLETLKNNYAVCGVDLSITTDLTSACFVIEKDNKLNIISHFWLPTEKLKEATERDAIPYDKYIDKGWLSLSGSNIIEYKDIYEWILTITKQYKILPLIVGYDKYCSNYLVADLKQAGFRCEPIIQGPALSSCITELEGRIKDKTINFGNNTLLRMHLLDTAIKQTNDGRSGIVKIAKNSHIDGTAALLDAIASRRYFPEIKKQLENKR